MGKRKRTQQPSELNTDDHHHHTIRHHRNKAPQPSNQINNNIENQVGYKNQNKSTAYTLQAFLAASTNQFSKHLYNNHHLGAAFKIKPALKQPDEKVIQQEKSPAINVDQSIERAEIKDQIEASLLEHVDVVAEVKKEENTAGISVNNVIEVIVDEALVVAQPAVAEIVDQVSEPKKEKVKETFQKSVWSDVSNQEQFVAVFSRIKSSYEDMEKCRDDFIESMKDIDEMEMVKWVTNGEKNLDNLFKNKNYPADEAARISIYICEQEIYCKDRAKGPNIKSWSGYFLSFITTVYTGPFKINGMREVQLDLLTHGLDGFRERLNNPESKLYKYSGALLENGSDAKGFIDQVQSIQLNAVDTLETKKNMEKDIKSGITLFAPVKNIPDAAEQADSQLENKLTGMRLG